MTIEPKVILLFICVPLLLARRLRINAIQADALKVVQS
jgi:hypothetical protein